jgi:cysteine synthase
VFFFILTQFLRSVNPNLKVIAVEPTESAVLSGKPPGPHRIQGIGAGFIPLNCDTSLINEVVTVTSDKSIETARAVAKKDGIFVGISSGASIAAAIEVKESLC